MIRTEMLEALELSRCLFLMNYVHGSSLLENSMPFDSRKSAEKTAEALGRVLILDLVLRNEDRLRCRALGWRGNYANLLVVDKESYANLDSLDDVHDSAIIRYKPEIIRSRQKPQQRRAASISGSISSDVSELMLATIIKYHLIIVIVLLSPIVIWWQRSIRSEEIFVVL
uniref:Actin-fragmin kinase catalytic domain-containing protein n=1 Tax=Arundo donax TaxID=35708 RepID=A0A0A9CXL0_ARUDO